MSIFNSLGSNYDFGFAVRSLMGLGNKDRSLKLKKLLEERYGGKAILTYKGREALRLALKAINKSEEYVVGICGFTCFAVCEAIEKEGYKIEYLDIERDSLNFSYETLVSSYKKNPRLKIIFIQNTLGYPCDMGKISKFCSEKDIILVEDLAHSVGTKYTYGQEAGTVGDFVMLSFSQDKVIDRVSGGALIVRSSKFSTKLESTNLKEVVTNQQIKDRFYPLLTVMIRKMYGSGVGKIFHYVFKQANCLTNPMFYSDMNNIHSLPDAYVDSVYRQYKDLDKNLSHRKKIAKVYIDLIDKDLLLNPIIKSLNLSSNLRFPIFVDDRATLIKYLKEKRVFVSDIWYDVPIAPKNYLQKTTYHKGNCPNSEEVSGKILNLPTHKNVTEKDAARIAEKINLWSKSQ